jgi:hypothetical protein
MKSNKYMPPVSLEGPVEDSQGYELLAYKLGIKDYYHEYEQGIDEGTTIFYGGIPPQYIKVYK